MHTHSGTSHDHSHAHGASHVRAVSSTDGKQRLTQTIQDLRKQGFKQTPQRAMVLKVLMEHKGHVSAEEILDHIRSESESGFDLSTVYRTLHMLMDVAIVNEIRDGNKIAYELAEEEEHHHLICKSCGKLQEVDHQAFESLEKSLRKNHGFSPDLRHMAIYGLCSKCTTSLKS